MLTSKTSFIPQIHLLCMQDKFITAFEAARESHGLPASVSVQIHDYALSQLPPSVQFDTIVSPANSYGILDGAFDDAISRSLSPRDDYIALTRVAQARLYEQWRGFAPPGSCTLVEIPEDFTPRSRNVWGCRRVAMCPTMRLPDDARWDREVVYECLWSLLCAVDNHNRAMRARKKLGEENETTGTGTGIGGDDSGGEICSVLMTPMATGIGRVSAEKWAAQAVLAMKHFVQASEEPEKWSGLNWADLAKHTAEVRLTWEK